MIRDFGEGRHGSDLDTFAALITRRSDSAQFADSTQIDYYLRLPDSILQPVETVEPSGQHPGIGSVLLEEFLRVGDGSRLKQLESGHYVSYDSHNSPSNPAKYPPSNVCRHICAMSGCCIGRPASSEVRIVSAFTGAR